MQRPHEALYQLWIVSLESDRVLRTDPSCWVCRTHVKGQWSVPNLSERLLAFFLRNQSPLNIRAVIYCILLKHGQMFQQKLFTDLFSRDALHMPATSSYSRFCYVGLQACCVFRSHVKRHALLFITFDFN